MTIKINSDSAKKTNEIGQKVASQLTEGDFVALRGDLGAGKTVFTKGIAKGLGISETVVSPTFSIIKEYKGDKLSLFHFDVYRIDSGHLTDLGYEEYFFSSAVVVVEWSEKITDKLPQDYLLVKINYGNNENERDIEISGIGQWEKRLPQLKKLF